MNAKKPVAPSENAMLSLAELESQAMAAWMLFPTDPLWELVDAGWFRDTRWQRVWTWVAQHPEIRPVDRWERLLVHARSLALAVMDAVAHWHDTLCWPEIVLPALRQVMEYRRTQVILAEGLALDPLERDPADWTVEALQAELARRTRATRRGMNAAEGIQALTAQLLEMDTNGGRNPAMISTGYGALDHAMFGLWPEDFVVIGGRPGTGKTTLVLNWVRHWLNAGLSVGYFSLEMSAESLHAAWAAQTLLWPVKQILSPMHAADRHQVHEQLNAQYPWPLRMWTDPLTLDDLRTTARQWHRDQPLRVLVVDYLQLLERPMGMTREEHVSSVSLGLRNLAKELKIPVVVISSSNRSNVGADAPSMRELRDSGQIEHDATKILLTWEPDPQPPDARGGKSMRVQVVKVRQGGQLGTVLLRLYPASQRIESRPIGADAEDHP